MAITNRMAITNSMGEAQFGMHAQEEMMRQRYWEEQQRRMMQSMYYDDNRNGFAVPRSQSDVKEAPKPVPSSSASDPLAFMNNQANKVLLTQGEI
jgi:hypothetical protein